jgi:hypothetical protein
MVYPYSSNYKKVNKKNFDFPLFIILATNGATKMATSVTSFIISPARKLS